MADVRALRRLLPLCLACVALAGCTDDNGEDNPQTLSPSPWSSPTETAAMTAGPGPLPPLHVPDGATVLMAQRRGRGSAVLGPIRVPPTFDIISQCTAGGTLALRLGPSTYQKDNNCFGAGVENTWTVNRPTGSESVEIELTTESATEWVLLVTTAGSTP